MRLHIKQLPFPPTEFYVKFLGYLLARAAHRVKENVPAPFPEHDALRVIADALDRGESLEIYDDPPPPADSAANAIALAGKEYRDEQFRAAVEAEKQRLRNADAQPAPVTVARRSTLLDFIA